MEVLQGKTIRMKHEANRSTRGYPKVSGISR